jgi:hypothetical protein
MTYLLRTAMMLSAVLCTTAGRPLAAQQAQDATLVAPVSAVRDSSTNTSTVAQGPRATPVFQSVVPRLDRSNALTSPALPQEGGQNTFVISTLGLVLIALIIVLLIR